MATAIGNHSMSHPQMGGLGLRAQLQEIDWPMQCCSG
jgi:hypothetical protein